MAIGSKQKYTDAQKRKAEHIEDSYEAKGVSHEKAEQIAWATVNKQSGGGERSGSGTTTPETTKEAARKDSAEHAAETRQAKAEPNALEKQSIAALRSKARKKHISGRSTMSKVELILALRQKR
ncbi:termination factor Rho [Cellvibrio sp. UBA7671]|uniref:termination factor Rho n=1 Tax=Cellvibrio sp. UBA7671 TaxID=1946312 RepID=UPI002F356FEC